MFTSYLHIDKKKLEPSGGKKRPATAETSSRMSRPKKSKTNSDKENDLLLAKAPVVNHYNVSFKMVIELYLYYS